MRTVFIFLMAALLFSCKRDRLTEENIRVNHYRGTAHGFVPQLVFLTQESEILGTNTWHNFYDRIENFDYQPGYIYDLKVNVIELEEELQDASSLRYVLKEVLSQEKVPDTTKFKVNLINYYTEYVFKDDQSGDYTILNKIRIDCGTLCQELETQLDTAEVLSGIFEHGANGEYKLVELNPNMP